LKCRIRNGDSHTDSPVVFSDFVEALGVSPLPYVGGAAPRNTGLSFTFLSYFSSLLTLSSLLSLSPCKNMKLAKNKVHLNEVYKDVHTTNESPPDQPIPFHHEMAQVPLYPKSVLFYCLVPPVTGKPSHYVTSLFAVSFVL
jgi:hypothetical protein